MDVEELARRAVVQQQDAARLIRTSRVIYDDVARTLADARRAVDQARTHRGVAPPAGSDRADENATV
jgi:hypothetical protein